MPMLMYKQKFLDKLILQLLNLWQVSQQTYVELYLTNHRVKSMEIKLCCLCSRSFSFLLLLHMYKVGFKAVFQYHSTSTNQLCLSPLFCQNDLINLYYKLPSDLVGPTGDMLDGGTLLNRIQIILTYRSKQICQIYCEYVTGDYGCLLRQEQYFPAA